MSSNNRNSNSSKIMLTTNSHTPNKRITLNQRFSNLPDRTNIKIQIVKDGYNNTHSNNEIRRVIDNTNKKDELIQQKRLIVKPKKEIHINNSNNDNNNHNNIESNNTH